jgi:endonuclease YncB( thermonuclease family)
MPRGEVAQILSNVHLLTELPPGPPPDMEEVELYTVLDGDTIKVVYQGQVETVELIGIDAPEEGEPWAAEAEDLLASMTYGMSKGLEFDVRKRDEQGNLLAYLWLFREDLYWMANESLLYAGVAVTSAVAPNLAYQQLFAEAQAVAQAAGEGMWGSGGSIPLEITDLQIVPPGEEDGDLNAEWIEFGVVANGSLAGYAVEDDQGHRYEFPDEVFTMGQVFKLHSGPGTDSTTDLFWGSASPIWDNDQDCIYLLDGDDNVLWEFPYFSG